MPTDPLPKASQRWPLRVAVLAYYVTFAFFHAGFLFHRSSDPVVYEWSAGQLALVAWLSLGYLVPPLLMRMWRRLGRRRFLLAFTPLVLLLASGYGVLFVRHYFFKVHQFDPYLQVPPEDFPDEARADGEALRILTLGGSTTECGELPAQARYPRVLEAKLREHYPALPLEVLNAGKPGYTSKHSLSIYTTYYHEWQPDVIVVMHAANDIYRSFSPERYSLGRRYNRHYSHYYGSSANGANPPTLMRSLIRRMPGQINKTWYSTLRTKLVDYDLDRYNSLREFDKHLRKLVEVATNDGAAMVFVTQPYLYHGAMSRREEERLFLGYELCRDHGNLWKIRHPSPRSLRTAMDGFNRTTREIARETGSVLADLEPALEKTLESFVDDVHYTEKGSRAVAGFVASTMIAADLLPRVARRRAGAK